MKYIHITLTLLLSALSVMVRPVYSQQPDRQMDHINRDINIMKNILEEMFKVKPGTATVSFSALPIPFSVWNNEERIEGIYVDDYGIILFIPNPASSDMLLVSRFGEEDFTYSFYYGEDDSSDSIISKESVISQITEFFINYAAASINQLKSDENLTVLFGGRPSAEVMGRVQRFTHNSDSVKPFLQTISVTALKSDLEAYHNDQLSERAFRERLRTSSKNSDESESLDLKIMANILKTALTENGESHVRIGKDVSYLGLDDFGAIFFLDIHLQYSPFSFSGPATSFRSSPASGNSQFHARRSSIPIHPDSVASINVDKNKNGGAVITYRSTSGTQVTRSAEKESSITQNSEELKKIYKQLVSSMKAYLVDYGNTLNSIKPDQTVLLSVSLTSLPSHNNSIPDHVDVQVKKSVLEAMSKGNMSREEAIGQIVVREY